MPASNLKQCLLPASAILVDNPNGSAPGFRLKLNKAWLFFTPGVPGEFKPMVKEQFLPFVREHFETGESTTLHKLLTLGHGESSLADQLNALPCPTGITLGYRPSMPHVEIKLFARGKQAIDSLPAYINAVKALLGSAVVADNRASLAETIHFLLLESGHSLSLAESCTGGMLSSDLVEFAGSSAYLKQGLVTYSNEAKMKVLGVKSETLNTSGAVSMETAREMAEGARRLLDTDFALSTTGIAGPEGGSDEKPVGTVCIALATRNRIHVQRVQLGNRSRTLVRSLSCAVAFDMLRRALLGQNPVVDYPFISRSDHAQF
jgi:nicotinamide-nucleotide amidase